MSRGCGEKQSLGRRSTVAGTSGSRHRVTVALPALSVLPPSLVVYGPAQEEAPGFSDVWFVRLKSGNSRRKPLQTFINIWSSMNSDILCTETQFHLRLLPYSFLCVCLFCPFSSSFFGGCLVAHSCILSYQTVPSYNLSLCAEGNPP